MEGLFGVTMAILGKLRVVIFDPRQKQDTEPQADRISIMISPGIP